MVVFFWFQEHVYAGSESCLERKYEIPVGMGDVIPGCQKVLQTVCVLNQMGLGKEGGGDKQKGDTLLVGFLIDSKMGDQKPSHWLFPDININEGALYKNKVALYPEDILSLNKMFNNKRRGGAFSQGYSICKYSGHVVSSFGLQEKEYEKNDFFVGVLLMLPKNREKEETGKEIEVLVSLCDKLEKTFFHRWGMNKDKHEGCTYCRNLADAFLAELYEKLNSYATYTVEGKISGNGNNNRSNGNKLALYCENLAQKPHEKYKKRIVNGKEVLKAAKEYANPARVMIISGV